MEPKKTYMILHILTLAVIRTTGLSHYVEKLDELPFSTTKMFSLFFLFETTHKMDMRSNGKNFKKLDIHYSPSFRTL